MAYPNEQRGKQFIGVGAVALIHDGKGNLLLQKRGEQARDEQGKWDLCGGAIEFGDTIEQTIKRELMEELCTTPLKIEFLTVYDAFREIDNQPTHWVSIIYAVEVDRSAVNIGEPHKIAELGWFTSKNLPSPLHSQFQKSYEPALQAGIIS
jgi:8-oxo-dGTP diphosphatase